MDSPYSHFALCCQLSTTISPKQLTDVLVKVHSAEILIRDRIDATSCLRAAGFSTSITQAAWDKAEVALQKTKYADIKMITCVDQRYPPFLRDLKSPVPILYIKGNERILGQLPGVSIVGTRKVTDNGRVITERIAGYFADNNWVVVSGLAIGVDAAAHTGCLDHQGRTVAVLAGGLHQANPKQNAALADRILEGDGAWISEHPIGAPPRPRNFVQRNRIQVGLSAGSIIVEADENSGSMTQAGFCLELRRPLFAVLPNEQVIDLKLLSKGTKQLVDSGSAMPIRDKRDYPKVAGVLFDYRNKLLGTRDSSAAPHS